MAHYTSDEDYDPATSDEGPSDWEERHYRVWVCLGCENARFEIFFHTHPPAPWEEEFSIFYPVVEREEISSKHFREINESLDSIYKEIIQSYNMGLSVACAILIRALLEGICASKGITDNEEWSLEEKLKLLCDKKHIPADVINALIGMKIIGDVAAHQLEKPSQLELRSAIQFVEILLDLMYEIEPRVLERADLVTRLTKKRVLEQEATKQVRKQHRAQNRKQLASDSSESQQNDG